MAYVDYVPDSRKLHAVVVLLLLEGDDFDDRKSPSVGISYSIPDIYMLLYASLDWKKFKKGCEQSGT